MLGATPQFTSLLMGEVGAQRREGVTHVFAIASTSCLLALAVVVLGLTVLLGGALIVVALRDRRPKPPAIILALLHGLAALTGLGALLWALQGPARGVATGTQYFGIAAAILLLLAAILGVTTLVLHLRRRRLPGFLAGAHATIAIIGTVILLAYFLLG